LLAETFSYEYWTLVLSACGFRARVFHATKTEMIRAGVDFAFVARADDVTGTILVVAKKRAAAVVRPAKVFVSTPTMLRM
jgi:dihydroxyacetone kinase-like predicted kinase